MTTENKTMQWESEVELSSGTKIVVDKKLKVGSMHPTQWGDRKVVSCRLALVEKRDQSDDGEIN